MKTIVFSLLLFVIACSKTVESEVPVTAHIDIQIRNKQGIDLLHPASPGTLNTGAFKVFYKTNSGWQDAYDSDLDCPNQICLRESDGSYIARLFTNTISGDAFTETKVVWNGQQTDVIKCRTVRDKDGQFISNAQVWYNDELVLPDKMIPGSSNGILIIKD
jgi:hypothetical protein